MMKSKILILVTILTVFCSCNKDDDLNEIFKGKFKITGYRINGKYTNEGLKELNSSMDNYWIAFNGSSFNGMLKDGVTFNGTWQANSESREMKMTVGGTPIYPTDLSRLIINIIKGATSYSGDHNVLKINQDSNNYIDLDSGKY